MGYRVGRLPFLDQPEIRCVASFWQLDAQQAVLPFTRVVLCKLGPHAGHFDANDRVDTGIVIRSLVENLDAQNVFLEVAALAAQCPFDQVSEELAAPLRATELGAGKDPFEFAANGIRVALHKPAADVRGTARSHGAEYNTGRKALITRDCIVTKAFVTA